MINLSKITFTDNQIRLLKRGPKFCPVYDAKETDFYEGKKIFTKKLAQQEKYFDVTNNDQSLIRPQSKKYTTTNNKVLSDIISTVGKLNPNPKKTFDNIDIEEKKAIEELKALCKTSIEIKKADKSNTLVIMDKTDYRDKLVMKGHLLTSTYEKAPNDANKTVFKGLEKLCSKYYDGPTKKESEVILKEDWTESNFYALPKIHKCKEILDFISHNKEEFISIPYPDSLKGRPINGDVNSVTHGLSKLIEKILKPLVMYLKTYIKDEYDFLRKFPKEIPPNSRVISCDVVSLYTSIPLELGIEALNYWIDKLSTLIPDRFSKAFILESVQFILTNNYFMFDCTIWHQLCGTAMGKSFAPPYACLTVGFLEETILIPITLPQNFDESICRTIVTFLMRYIDDDILVLPNSISIEKFLSVMNSLHPSIQFTASSPSIHTISGITYNCTNFLSIKVLVSNDNLVKFDVYYKETNAHDYLPFDSHHPNHTKENIPYVLAKRIIVISSEEDWIRNNLIDLRRFLLECKYPNDVITKGIKNARLQGPANRSQSKIIPLITPFVGNLDGSNIINAARDLISSSSNERIKKVFDGVKMVQCNTQTRNLLQLLSSSRFVSNASKENEKTGIFHCTSKKCEICNFNYLQQCRSFVTSNGSKWKVKCHVTCNSLNVIYFLRCNFCHQETKLGKTDNFRLRINNHRSASRLGKSSDIFDNHVYKCSHDNGPIIEPLFHAYIMMACSNYDKLLNIERNLHLESHDTTFKLT